MSSGTFLYFAYGSNLLLQRVRRGNPSAVFKTVALLQDYKLVFRAFADPYMLRWSGGVATIEKSVGSHVWGIVWELGNEDLPGLDRQESVYNAINVDVSTPNSEMFKCRTYMLQEFERNPAWDDRPSPQYKDILVRGAIQNEIPREYIEFLKSIDHNGFSGTIALYDEIIASVEKSQT